MQNRAHISARKIFSSAWSRRVGRKSHVKCLISHFKTLQFPCIVRKSCGNFSSLQITSFLRSILSWTIGLDQWVRKNSASCCSLMFSVQNDGYFPVFLLRWKRQGLNSLWCRKAWFPRIWSITWSLINVLHAYQMSFSFEHCLNIPVWVHTPNVMFTGFQR